MGTAADVIAAMAAGESVTTTKKRKVGKGKAAVELTVTRTEPTTVTVVDETVTEGHSGRLPEDAGKRSIDVLPGLKLVMYGKGYCCVRVKGKGWNGGKVEVGKPLYRDDVKVLVDALLAEIDNIKTYDEANGTVPF